MSSLLTLIRRLSQGSENLVGLSQVLARFNLCQEEILIGNKQIFQYFQHGIVDSPGREELAVFFRNCRAVRQALNSLQLQQSLYGVSDPQPCSSHWDARQ
jgi:hypothetical protein